MNFRIDHIVYCVLDLDEAIIQFEELLGAQVFYGGKHINEGTHNAIIPLRGGAYFELLAIDKSNSVVIENHWMGIDHLKEPRLTRWCIKSEDIREDISNLERIRPELTKMMHGQRQTPAGDTLQWEMTRPLSTPHIEPIPFFIDWSKGQYHPSSISTPQCAIKSIRIHHPNEAELKDHFDKIKVDVDIKKSLKARIELILDSPNGHVTLF